MQKNLVIVESPAKAKTIEKFLGKDFKVLSSYGHIRDLKKKEFSIDIQKDFKPNYEIPADKKELVAKLQAEAQKADVVWLASDEDREGEAIAWHLYEVLKLKPEQTKRIVFHEITKTAILKAIENPREIDINLVNAQQARRILDRIVGFELSPVLWKKVKPALSAGRVQSVAVRLIVEREREIQAFKSEASYRVTAIFLVPDTDGKLVEMKAELAHRLKTKEEAKAFTGKEPEEALEIIGKLCSIAIVKIGCRGSLIRKGTEEVRVSAIPVKKVIDTTGAGDYFAAGFLYGLTCGYSLEKCAKIGSILSGNVIQVIGTTISKERWDEIKLNINEVLSE